MKKHLLSISILLVLIACNETTSPPGVIPASIIDTQLPKVDTLKPLISNNSIGSGLTLEEMKDDSVFTDGSIPTSWEVAGITDVKNFKLFLKRVQLLVLNDEKEQLAKFIKYPLGRSIKSEAEFIKNYDRIFTKDAKLSIAKINFSQIFRNSKGAMSEEGRVWFQQEVDEFKIIAVNN